MFDSNIVIICLYVYDMLVFSNSISYFKDTKDFLSLHFDMKYMQSEESRESNSRVAVRTPECNEGGHTTLRRLRGGPPRRLGVTTQRKTLTTSALSSQND
jgi:hypothetical protein